MKTRKENYIISGYDLSVFSSDEIKNLAEHCEVCTEEDVVITAPTDDFWALKEFLEENNVVCIEFWEDAVDNGWLPRVPKKVRNY